MAGIVFFRTTMLSRLVEFYTSKLGFSEWIVQKDCTILKHGNLLIGFCQREISETQGMVTLFYETKTEVDEVYDSLKQFSVSPPGENMDYQIYQFFAKDPEGRDLEFQSFLHPLKPLQVEPFLIQ